MAAIETTYGNGGVQTNTQGMPLTQGGDLSSILAELVRRKLQQPTPRFSAEPMLRAPMRETMHSQPSTPRPAMKSPLERERERAELLKLKTMTQGPRMRYTGASYGAPWMAGHLEPDVEHMNAFERQAYLPSGAGMAPGGADTRSDEEDLLRLHAQLRALQSGGR